MRPAKFAPLLVLLFLVQASLVLKGQTIAMTVPVKVGAMNANALSLVWQTNLPPDQSFVRYGTDPNLLSGVTNATLNGLTSEATLNGLLPAQIIYARAFSIRGADTCSSAVNVYATASLSSGKTKVYFNTPIDTTVATFQKAVYLFKTLDDTLIAYINRANVSIDLAVYNFNNTGLSNMSAALNAAYQRGVKIRIVYEGSTGNLGLNTVDTAIKRIERPADPSGAIMHNKFVIFDAEAPDPNAAFVWTGSTNLTRDQMNSDHNHVVIVQDQALARGYTLEFNEMWGDTGQTPNPTNAKFGADKTDNTPHIYRIGGKLVESYFSPSDQTNAHLLATVDSAEHDLRFATMLFTRQDVANRIKSRFQIDGIDVRGVVDQSTDSASVVFQTLFNALGTRIAMYNGAHILHHKYLLTDALSPGAHSCVWTGSHNWTSGADQKNDENTLVFHDPDLTNQFYQEFVSRYDENKDSSVLHLTLKAYLEGCFSADTLKNDLGAAGLLPLVQPYGQPPFNYFGADSVSVMPPNAVDWALVELRDTATFAVVSRRAALLLTDGSLSTNLYAPASRYFLSIRHRNHLTTGYAAPVALTAPETSLTVDLTNPANILGGATFATVLPNGKAALKAADATADNYLTAADYQRWAADNSGVYLYAPADFNLDGFIAVDDFILWVKNNGAVSFLAD